MSRETETLEDQRLERQLTERRRAPFPRLVLGAIVYGRRRGPRRITDTGACYVDWYDARLFVAAVGIYLLCCVDALFTLILLDMGAEEVNPFMAALLEQSVKAFVYTKLVITGLGVIFLVMHAAFWIGGTIRVNQVLYALLAGYVTLFLYQLSMFNQVF